MLVLNQVGVVVFLRFFPLTVLVSSFDSGAPLIAYARGVDLEVGGRTSLWTDPQVPLSRRRPIHHDLLPLPMSWPPGGTMVIHNDGRC